MLFCLLSCLLKHIWCSFVYFIGPASSRRGYKNQEPDQWCPQQTSQQRKHECRGDQEDCERASTVFTQAVWDGLQENGSWSWRGFVFIIVLIRVEERRETINPENLSSFFGRSNILKRTLEDSFRNSSNLRKSLINVGHLTKELYSFVLWWLQVKLHFYVLSILLEFWMVQLHQLMCTFESSVKWL